MFETFEYLGQHLTSSCQFWNDKSIPLQILHQSSVSWDITPLHFLSWKILHTFGKRSHESKNLVKFHVSSWMFEMLHFDGFLLSKSHKVSAKEVQISYLLWHWKVMQSLLKN